MFALARTRSVSYTHLVGNSEAFTVNSVADGWVEISVDDSVGYISQDYVTLAQALPTAKTIEQVKYGDGVSDVRASVVSYALQFVGNRYVWGGTSPVSYTHLDVYKRQ